MNTLVIAHRGASQAAPENTMEAFALACGQGADGIELDVQLTADGGLAVFHDDTLDRVTDLTGPIAAKTMAELKEANASRLWPDRPPCRIPTLEEVYSFLKGNSMLVNVELKENAIPDPVFIGAVAKLETEYGLTDRIVYSSFNHYSLMALRELLPHAKIGLLYAEGLYEPWNYAKLLEAEFLHPHWRSCLFEEFAAGAREAGIGVNAWTIDDPDALRKAFDLGINAVITNRPELALRLRG